MKIKVHTKPGARQQAIERLPDGSLRIWVRSQPDGGEANKELIEYLSSSLEIRKSAVRISVGSSSRYKILDIDMEEPAFLSRIEALLGANS